MKKKTAAFVICIFLIVALFIVYIFSELYTESDIITNKENSITDAQKFEKEYEELNESVTTTDKKVRSIQINSKNPFVYTTEEELITKMDEKETFIVYFGFAECPWCRSVLEKFIETAEEYNVEKVYYLDVQNIRDVYELDENNNAIRTKEGTEGYYKLLTRLDSVLSNYRPLTYTTSKGKTKTVAIPEKRIYAPNFVLVQNGEATMLEEGISPEETDPYMTLTDSILNYQKEQFGKLFAIYNKKIIKTTCSDTMC